MLVISTEEMNVPAQKNCRIGDKIIVTRQLHSQQLEPLFVLCGKTLFQPISITNSTAVILDFTSDSHNPSSVSEGRFKLRFEQIPNFT